ncbi:hypothetical protein Pla110_33530 [Polystyrenella longa]|uniref:Uncharacterized protein n=1 Tax=Polystyrenella longa TaxID=2528007 RepID=A0A518CQV8_9PLAN|nr:hypothetical protein [Polystyrenella longa]QDU81611.1 hypothetical protein Pla110_33530 [Polystyrenella longa]
MTELSPDPDADPNSSTIRTGDVTEAKQAGRWADFTLLAIHLTAAGYLYWVLVLLVPQYTQLFEEFDLPLPEMTVILIGISSQLVDFQYSLIPLAGVLFAISDIYMIRYTEGKWWRPFWLYGAPLLLMGTAGLVQFVFQLALQQAQPF